MGGSPLTRGQGSVLRGGGAAGPWEGEGRGVGDTGMHQEAAKAANAWGSTRDVLEERRGLGFGTQKSVYQK